MTSVIIFDLDGTLYESKMLDQENLQAAVAAICAEKGVNNEEGQELLAKARSIKGGTTSISKALSDLGIDDSRVRHHQLKALRPEKHLSNDLELINLMRDLHKLHKFALLTNTRREIVERILAVIGFAVNDFDLIIAGGDGFPPKPSKGTLENIISHFGANPRLSYTIGDRWIVDHEPGIELGITPVHVSNRTELINWLKCATLTANTKKIGKPI